MDEKQARKILSDNITNDNGLFSFTGEPYFDWNIGEDSARLDGQFYIEELEAITWWMKNKG